MQLGQPQPAFTKRRNGKKFMLTCNVPAV